MPHIGSSELIIIFIIILLLFGAKRLPELARGLGNGIREFKKSVNDASSAVNENDARSTKEKAE